MEDYEKLVNEILQGPLGDLARERLVTEMLEELAHHTDRYTYASDEARENDRAWYADVAEWIRENFL